MVQKKPYIGGQAVIEGVMMKSPNYISTAVRKPSKKIKTKTEKSVSLTVRSKLLGLPFIRGVVSLFEMLIIGFKTLTYSANEALEEEEEELGKVGMFLTIMSAVLFGLGLFVVLPYVLTVLVGVIEESNALLFNFIDGMIKLVIFIIYLIVISFMHDIKRVFQYHGAEHKTVNCYEAGEKLIVKNVKKYSALHPRCGTSFILIVILIGVVVLSFVPIFMQFIFSGVMDWHWALKRLILLFGRILFLLPIAGIAYEFLRLSARFRDSKVMEFCMSPGLLAQRLTTREPSTDQIEVAIAALKEVCKKEKI